MNLCDRSLLTNLFNKLHHEISRQGNDADYEAEYRRLIIKELAEASQRAILYLQLIEAGRK